MIEGVLLAHRQIEGITTDLITLTERMVAKWPDQPQFAAVLAELRIASEGTGATAAVEPLTWQAILQELEAFPMAGQDAVAAFQRALSPDMLGRELVSDAPDQDVLLSPRASGNTVAIVFTGLANQAMAPISIIDSYLSAAGITAIYLRDFNRLLYTIGVKSLGADFDSTATALQSLIASLGNFEKTLFIGVSGGGMGALNFGAALKADRILGFSAPTDASEAFVRKLGDSRALVLQAQLHSLAPAKYLSVRGQITHFDMPAPIDLIYCEDMAFDRAHAENISDFPNVTLYPFRQKSGHNSLLEAILSGSMLDILKGDMSGMAL